MSERLLLDEHSAAAIATSLQDLGHDVLAVVAQRDLRGAADHAVFAWATIRQRRIVTENVADFRPLLLAAMADDAPAAALLLVDGRRFPRGRGARQARITAALGEWLIRNGPGAPVEAWLV